MNDTKWDVLPYPYMLLADPHPTFDCGELPGILARLLEDATAQAGVLASAVRDPEVDVGDVAYAVRTLAEHLHATMALWRQWREQEEPGEPGAA